MELEKLKVLEARIELILNQHAKVCEERDRLGQRLEQAEARAEEIEAKLADQVREREEIKTRVERILGRLDGIGLG